MEEQIIKLIGADSSIKILKPFKLVSYFYEGKIQIRHEGAELDFDVLVPKCYPLTLPNVDNISIIFKNEKLIGYPHINNDGSVCFHPDKDENFERKLKSEITGLKTWIYDYFICKKEDNNYTYLVHNTGGNKSSTMYFSENDKKFKKDDCGVFDYSSLTNNMFDGKKVQTFYRIGFDQKFQDKWSTDFLLKLKLQQYKGIWVYIENEPIVDELGIRKSINKWDEFQKYLPDNFIKYLYNNFKKLNNNFFFEEELYLMIGYKIPNNEVYEIHWDLVKIPKIKLPVKLVFVSKKTIGLGRNEYVLATDNILWGNTVNCNYERFFGRGKLSENLINSRILIIGCGALGSSLAEILVKGGCRNLVLDDFDYVASGNLCRSNYNLSNLNTPKIESLKNNLLNISPYVNVLNIPLKLSHYSNTEDWVNKNIDFVFDCSTDTEVTYIFDEIDFIGKVFSISITNKARELICVSGKEITKKTNHFYNFLGNKEPTYFEGTGCGYPTFEANFNEISSLLNLAIMNINDQIDKTFFSDNFIINQTFEKGFKSLKIRGFDSFYEKSGKKYLYISNETLFKIKEELNFHYPNEFGGVFIGFKDENSIVIDDVLVPDDFENGKTIFVRHPGTLNDRLDLKFNETKGKITYVGEWHSHPNNPAYPSSTDINAMKQIAEDKKTGNSNPLLMIVKITKDIFEPIVYIYNEEKLLKYE